MYFTYVLKSLKDNQLYIGWTNDLISRLKEHNDGKVVSTSKRKPFIILYYEVCNMKEDAIGREKSLKTGFGRAYLKRRLRDI